MTNKTHLVGQNRPTDHVGISLKPTVPISPLHLKPFPKAWARKATIFDVQAEPQEKYKFDGVVDLDKEEAVSNKSEFENALVGRVIGRNLRFGWLASQLKDRWGAHEGFCFSDLGNGCFILFFGSRESRDDVWLGGPWHVAGYQLRLDLWTKSFIPSKNPPMCVPTWMLSGPSTTFLGEKNFRRIATEFGEPLLIVTFTRDKSRTIFSRAV